VKTFGKLHKISIFALTKTQEVFVGKAQKQKKFINTL